ncbi:MAG: hypothetical protein CL572_05300 [Alphaproteobacteria bacterium]|jgi:hypothetical protein|nr:hypothetical protein [Alphaproteobacteria bacterium]
MVNFLVILLILFTTKLAVSEENDPYAEIADIIASKKTPLDECNDYVTQKGWEQFVPISVGNKKILVICGSSTINEPPSSKNFLSSRGIAFDSAILDAQKSYSEFRSNKISEKISYKLREGFGIENKDPITKEDELTTEIEENFFDKLFQLANLEIEKKLKENEIVDEDKENVLDEINDISQSEVFTKTINTSTNISINGLQSFKVWEDCNEGEKQCRLAILVVRTAEQGFLAKSLIKPTSSFLRGEPSRAIPEKFTPKQILANVGTRIKRDENGDYHILATSISLPKTETGQSEKIAYEKAKTDAFGMIRRFAGAQIQSKTEKTVEQIFNEYKNGENENEIIDKFKQETESLSKSAKIKGIKIHDSGSVIHPANKNLIAKYIVAKWSIGSQNQATKNNMEIKKRGTTSIKKTEPIQQGTQIQSEEADF